MVRRFFVVVLLVLPLLWRGAPAAADASRVVQYSVMAVRDGVPYRSVVRVDFVGGSAQDQELVDVDEIDASSERPVPSVEIGRSGAVSVDGAQTLSPEEETICYFMALESENMTGVSRGDHWERAGAIPGGHQRTRFEVLGATPDGNVRLSIMREVWNDDGSTSRWRGELTYDPTGVVPTTIRLNGLISPDGTWATGTRTAALSIALTGDTFRSR